MVYWTAEKKDDILWVVRTEFLMVRWMVAKRVENWASGSAVHSVGIKVVVMVEYLSAAWSAEWKAVRRVADSDDRPVGEWGDWMAEKMDDSWAMHQVVQ